MPDRFKSPLYQEDLAYCANLPIHWDKLTGRTIAISGATGMIGTFLIDVLMKKNEDPHFDCRIIAIGRNKSRAQNRFLISMSRILVLYRWMCLSQEPIHLIRQISSFILLVQHIPERMLLNLFRPLRPM